jgi:hypothetical protein
MAAHVAPSSLALLTKRVRLLSTCAPVAAMRGRLASTPARSCPAQPVNSLTPRAKSQWPTPLLASPTVIRPNPSSQCAIF